MIQNMKQNRIKAYGYARVSTQGQDLEIQLKQNQDYAKNSVLLIHCSAINYRIDKMGFKIQPWKNCKKFNDVQKLGFMGLEWFCGEYQLYNAYHLHCVFGKYRAM